MLLYHDEAEWRGRERERGKSRANEYAVRRDVVVVVVSLEKIIFLSFSFFTMHDQLEHHFHSNFTIVYHRYPLRRLPFS